MFSENVINVHVCCVGIIKWCLYYFLLWEFNEVCFVAQYIIFCVYASVCVWIFQSTWKENMFSILRAQCLMQITPTFWIVLFGLLDHHLIWPLDLFWIGKGKSKSCIISVSLSKSPCISIVSIIWKFLLYYLVHWYS